jgi:hypothetical protein
MTPDNQLYVWELIYVPHRDSWSHVLIDR